MAEVQAGPPGGCGGQAAPPAAPAGSVLRLDSMVNNRTRKKETHRIVFFPKMCGCRTCLECGPRKGWALRQVLLAKAKGFRRPALLTLTVDREEFASPEAAHTYISDKGRRV